MRYPTGVATVSGCFRFLFGGVTLAMLCSAASIGAGEAEILTAIDEQADIGWEAASKIWEWAEPGYQETRSSALLASLLEKNGFTIEREVAGMPTAFTATYGTTGPVLGILGEYDALPGLSQVAAPLRKTREGATYGHGCGHHLFGAGSTMAAIAIKEEIAAGRVLGIVRFYGCPAEEGGSAKAFMTREGLFGDCAAVLHWHPSSRNAAGSGSNLARIAVKFKFRGQAAHAAGAPEQGRSALDAVTLTNHAAELLREHTPDFTRIHHVITAGGEAPNVVPAYAEVYYYIRHPDADVLRDLYPRLEKCARGAALATETELIIDHQGGILNLLPNRALSTRLMANLKRLNNLAVPPEDEEFTLRIREQLPSPKPLGTLSEVRDGSRDISKGSTDVGDVSWVVPTAGITTACWVPGTPGHSWQAVACGQSTLAKKGMVLAAKVLAVTGAELLSDPDALAAAKREHQQRVNTKPYKPLLLDGQQPPLDYRNPPKR